MHFVIEISHRDEVSRTRTVNDLDNQFAIFRIVFNPIEFLNEWFFFRLILCVTHLNSRSVVANKRLPKKLTDKSCFSCSRSAHQYQCHLIWKTGWRLCSCQAHIVRLSKVPIRCRTPMPIKIIEQQLSDGLLWCDNKTRALRKRVNYTLWGNWLEINSEISPSCALWKAALGLSGRGKGKIGYKRISLSPHFSKIGKTSNLDSWARFRGIWDRQRPIPLPRAYKRGWMARRLSIVFIVQLNAL